MVSVFRIFMLVAVAHMIVYVYQNKPIKIIDIEGNCIEISDNWDCELPPEDFHIVRRLY